MVEKIKNVVEAIEKLTVLELNELIKALEEKFGVSGMMPTMVSNQSNGAQETESDIEKKVNIILSDCGENKIQVIKMLREINPQLGLKEAKDITDTVPQTIKEDVSAEESKTIKEKIESVGAKVELK